MTREHSSDLITPLIPDKLNEEPVILRGCSQSELAAIVAVCVGGGFVLGLIVGLLLAPIMVSVASGVAVGVGLAWWAMNKLQKFKRGRPPGYPMHMIMKKLHERGIHRSKFLFFDGQFSLGRTEW